jgi:glucokinase
MNKNLYLGIDLGGSEVKIAIVNGSGRIIEKTTFPNSYLSTPQDVVRRIIEKTEQMANLKNVCATGVGVAGDIDQENGIVRFSPNLKGWRNVKFKEMLERHLPKPVKIENDANAAALGALWLDGKGIFRNIVCVTLGTGIGGGLVFDCKIYHGATGTAGEIGHIPIDPYGRRCKCGSRGCVEAYLGANYLSEDAEKNRALMSSPVIQRLLKDGELRITPKIISEAANLGDKEARKIWDMYGERLGIILAGIVNLLNPELIVLAGGVSQAGSLILDPLKKTVEERAFKTPVKNCKIIISKHNKILGMVGAAFLNK